MSRTELASNNITSVAPLVIPLRRSPNSSLFGAAGLFGGSGSTVQLLLSYSNSESTLELLPQIDLTDIWYPRWTCRCSGTTLSSRYVLWMYSLSVRRIPMERGQCGRCRWHGIRPFVCSTSALLPTSRNGMSPMKMLFLMLHIDPLFWCLLCLCTPFQSDESQWNVANADVGGIRSVLCMCYICSTFNRDVICENQGSISIPLNLWDRS